MAAHLSGKPALFVSREDLTRVFYANEALHKYTLEQLAKDIDEFRFMGAGEPEHFVGRESVFYPYLVAEEKKELYVIS